MKNTNRFSTIVNKTLLLVIFMMVSIPEAFAQDPTDLPDAPVDEPAAPIDDYVWVMGLIGLVFVFLRFRAMTQQESRTQE
ncbi:hypothetical protein [Flavobacterium nackdongense]|uniref:Signal peptidase n=1 Tax=Flavobacterium nackdongense TaxID=2547394 RepID=A0A4P6YDP3_9FLAO|nr:hypothetical protein [Flavobacterium nackdongense]QBN20438.1 hypothetical protein E1750_17120 [Flavobacterium nackdongense]